MKKNSLRIYNFIVIVFIFLFSLIAWPELFKISADISWCANAHSGWCYYNGEWVCPGWWGINGGPGYGCYKGEAGYLKASSSVGCYPQGTWKQYPYAPDGHYHHKSFMFGSASNCVHQSEVRNCGQLAASEDTCTAGVPTIISGNWSVCADPRCPSDPDCICPPYSPVGEISSVDCTAITGWAADQDSINTPLTLRIYVNGSYFTQITADQRSSSAVCSALDGLDCGVCDTANWSSHGKCKHGFSFTIPASLKDGTDKSIRIVGVNIAPAGSDRDIATRVINCDLPCDNNVNLTSTANCNIVNLNATHSNPSFKNVTNTLTSSVGNCTWNASRINGSCIAFSGDLFDWTHTWQNCVTEGGVDYCSPVCSKTLFNQATNYIDTSCTNLTHTMSPNPLELGGNNKLIISNYLTTKTYSSESVTADPSGVASFTFNPTASTPTSKTFNINLLQEIDAIQVYHNWTEQINGCSNLTRHCFSNVGNFKIQSPEPIFTTTNGNVQIGNSTTNTGIIINAPCNYSLSTYVFGSERSNNIQLNNTFNCTNQLLCSLKSSILNNYTDRNKAKDANWYTALKNQLLNSPEEVEEANLTTGVLNVNAYTNNHAVITTYPDVVVNANQTCNKNNIFLIEGNLTIHPNLNGSGTLEGACMFIVNGTTTITAGNTTGSDEHINAFIITRDVNIVSDKDKLTINGGLISGDSTIFKRNVFGTGKPACEPSIVINYDGVRFINKFLQLTKEPVILNIREIVDKK